MVSATVALQQLVKYLDCLAVSIGVFIYVRVESCFLPKIDQNVEAVACDGIAQAECLDVILVRFFAVVLP